MMSIIIPVLNEEHGIFNLLELLKDRANDPKNIEFVVVDGGSIDNTISEVQRFSSSFQDLAVKCVDSAKGRGVQLHNGSLAASHDIFYFLHADSHPPKGFDSYILKAIAAGHPAGCFRMRFRSWHWWLIIIGWFSRFSWKASRGGDQSQYITRELYHQIGGYDTTVPIYEDYLLINKLYNINTYHVIQKWLTTSARRYEEVGVLKLQWFYLTIYWKKRNGSSIDEIYEYYLKWCGVSKDAVEQVSD
ncbi:glycosyl transferase family 2 [Nonlabens sp. YIK11]|uniref:TIGR04283 family arsenosugar biosynthesis glycosyltransferase n=1 Tax=Nonlabens sp. YIK11 TaxID=1453349 RepID=UPI0006DC1814|nr:TIGR04283 family arsenosugar biosynthesis glycosyltransferase [Nonlabens sp. YIK11]KQC32704.1 glycosyl transferase family 2 [Nonlabens sp. YIK11]